MFFSVDRIVGSKAELMGEDRSPLTVPVAMLPPGTREGDMLFYSKNGFSAAPEKTAERRSRVADMLAQMLKMPDGGEPGGKP